MANLTWTEEMTFFSIVSGALVACSGAGFMFEFDLEASGLRVDLHVMQHCVFWATLFILRILAEAFGVSTNRYSREYSRTTGAAFAVAVSTAGLAKILSSARFFLAPDSTKESMSRLCYCFFSRFFIVTAVLSLGLGCGALVFYVGKFMRSLKSYLGDRQAQADNQRLRDRIDDLNAIAILADFVSRGDPTNTGAPLYSATYCQYVKKLFTFQLTSQDVESLEFHSYKCRICERTFSVGAAVLVMPSSKKTVYDYNCWFKGVLGASITTESEKLSPRLIAELIRFRQMCGQSTSIGIFEYLRLQEQENSGPIAPAVDGN